MHSVDTSRCEVRRRGICTLADIMFHAMFPVVIQGSSLKLSNTKEISMLARRESADETKELLTETAAINEVVNMINNFTNRNLEISDDILLQLMARKFRVYAPVVNFINRKLEEGLNSGEFADLYILCRVLSLSIPHIEDADLKAQTYLHLSRVYSIHEIKDEFIQNNNEMHLAIALGRFPDLPNQLKESFIRKAGEFIQPGQTVSARLTACRVLESFASTRHDYETVARCVRVLFSHVADEIQEICDQTRASLINIMFSASNLDTNLILSECINAQLMMLRKKVDAGNIATRDEACLFGYGKKSGEDNTVATRTNSEDERFKIFQELLQKAAFIEGTLEDGLELNINIPVAVIRKMTEFAFGGNADVIVNFFLDKLRDSSGSRDKLNWIASQIINLYADQVKSTVVKQKARERLAELCKDKDDITDNDVLLARYAAELPDEQLLKLYRKALRWIDGSTVVNGENTHRQVCAAHILGSLGAFVNQDKYADVAPRIRHQCVEGLVRQVKMGERFRDDYMTSVVCYDLIEIMRHTSKLGLAVILSQCLAHSLAEMETKVARLDPESKFKPEQWRTTFFGIRPPKKAPDDEKDLECSIM